MQLIAITIAACVIFVSAGGTPDGADVALVTPRKAARSLRRRPLTTMDVDVTLWRKVDNVDERLIPGKACKTFTCGPSSVPGCVGPDAIAERILDQVPRVSKVVKHEYVYGTSCRQFVNVDHATCLV